MLNSEKEELVKKALAPFFAWSTTTSFFVQRVYPGNICVAETIAHELGHFFTVPPISGDRSKVERITLLPLFNDSQASSLVRHIASLSKEQQIETELQARAVNWLVARRFWGEQHWVVQTWEQPQELFGTVFAWPDIQKRLAQKRPHIVADIVMKVLEQNGITKENG